NGRLRGYAKRKSAVGCASGADGAPVVSHAKASAQSPTLRASTPMWSSGVLKVLSPSVGIASKLGLNPTTPQYDAGTRTEPMVSVPSARLHKPAATAAALPP